MRRRGYVFGLLGCGCALVHCGGEIDMEYTPSLSKDEPTVSVVPAPTPAAPANVDADEDEAITETLVEDGGVEEQEPAPEPEETPAIPHIFAKFGEYPSRWVTLYDLTNHFVTYAETTTQVTVHEEPLTEDLVKQTIYYDGLTIQHPCFGEQHIDGTVVCVGGKSQIIGSNAWVGEFNCYSVGELVVTVVGVAHVLQIDVVKLLDGPLNVAQSYHFAGLYQELGTNYPFPSQVAPGMLWCVDG